MLRAIGAVLILLAASVSAGAEWPMYQGDNLNTGAAATVDAASQLWWTWSSPDGEHIEAAPVAAEGVVVVTDWSGMVTALDEASGKPIWTYDMKEKIVSTPAVAFGWVYVADTKGDLVALDLRDGQEMATAKVGPTRAPITINEGKLFIGNEQGEMQAFTATTLDLLWSFGVADASEEFTFNNVTGLYKCLKAGTHPKRPIRTAPAVFGGSVVFGSMNHYVYAVDESGEPDGTTTLQWRHLTGDIVLASPVLETGDLRAYFASYDETVRSLSLQPAGASANNCIGTDLSAHWTFDVPGPIDASKVHSTPAYDGEYLYFGTNGGAVYAIDASDGDELWRYQTGGPVLASPVVANGTVVVGSDDGIVRWFDASNGTVIQTFQADAPIKSGAAILDGTVIVASEDGTVYRLGSDPPARPDLSVRGFALDGNLVSIHVDNVGKADSEPTTMQVWDNGTLSQTYDLPSIEAGGSHEVVHILIGRTGTVLLEAIIDPDQTQLEAGRENNKRSDAVFLVDEEEPVIENATDAPDTSSGFLGMPWWAWFTILGALVLGGGGTGGYFWWRRRNKASPFELEADDDAEELEETEEADEAPEDEEPEPGAPEEAPAEAATSEAAEEGWPEPEADDWDEWEDDWDPSLDMDDADFDDEP